MATVREIIVNWSGPQGGGLSIFHAEASQPVNIQRSTLNTFLTSVKAYMNNGHGYVIRTDGKEYDEATGALVGFWAEPTARTGFGTGASASVPDASQLLIRWKTDAIVNNRLLAGRTFIPGLLANAVTTGELDSAARVFIDSYAATAVAAASGLGIWHRPTPTAPGTGVFDEWFSASTWRELAVQRRRRQ